MQLVIVDTAQIQPFVFGSNRLRENIGASYLVAQATESWAMEAVREVTQRHNINANGTLDSTKHIEDSASDLEAEVLYAGGGNFVVLFREKNDCAQLFIRKLSKRALVDAPNLQLVITQAPVRWQEPPDIDDVLSSSVKAIFRKLAQEKRARSPSAPLLGLGVTVMCQSTGMPATERVQPIPTDSSSAYPASVEIVAKLAAVNAANARLEKTFRTAVGNEYVFPRDFDELGRTEGEHSYIAIVHADGNGMGQRIMGVGEAYPTAEKNRAYVDTLRRFSAAVEEAAQEALKTTLKRLVERAKKDGIDRITQTNGGGKKLTEIKLKPTDDGRYFLPFRPLVFGGDDVTFVCDGRLGLSLATDYLRNFEQETTKRPECRGKITACAGITIVKTHYPFARAYALSEDLCKSAKNYRRKQGLGGSCLDWHFALGGLSGDIEEIRRREYTAKSGGLLTLRPVTLDGNPNEPQRAWEVVAKGIAAFQDDGWAGRRNKIKALRDALREGPEAVRWFLTKFGLGDSLPEIQGYSGFAETGWWGGCCGYFDSIELSDGFIPL